MDGWLYLLIIGCLVILAWAIHLLFFGAAESVHDQAIVDCLSRQALKRNGALFGRVLTIPHKTVEIKVSFVEDSDGAESHTYATFRTEAFTDRKFGIYYWKELLFRPALLAGSRLELFEEEFGETYVVSGDDISFVRRVLTPEIRTKLIESEKAYLRIQFGRPHGSLTLNRERGWLTVSSYLNAGVLDQDYDCIIETAHLFYESFETLNRQ